MGVQGNPPQKGNITTKVYDKEGRLLTVTADGKTTTYAYNDNGSRQSVTYQNGAKESYTYYGNGLVKTLTNTKADGSVIDSITVNGAAVTYSYVYDSAHNMTSKMDIKGTTTYTYDGLNRLETVTEPTGKVTMYTYDKAGNRLTQAVTNGPTTQVTTYTYSEQNRLMNTATMYNGETDKTIYVYDNNGNMLSSAKTTVKSSTGAQAKGTISSVGGAGSNVTLYSYDVWNQLIKTATNGNIANYAYNGEGLRTQKTIKGAVTNYLYEADKVVLETDGTGSQISKNVYGTNLLTRTAGSDTYNYMYNGHADVTALLGTDGTVKGTYYYDAFGTITEQSGTVNNNITYAGYQYDSETGLYYLNSRMYDSKIARFLQEDDSSYSDPNDPLSLNLYTYCKNDPIIYLDPTGHSTADTIKTIINLDNMINTTPYLPDCAKNSIQSSMKELAVDDGTVNYYHDDKGKIQVYTRNDMKNLEVQLIKTDNDYTIKANVNFLSMNAANLECGDSGKTYKELAMEGIATRITRIG